MAFKTLSGGVETATVTSTASILTDIGVTVPPGCNRAEGYVRTASVVLDRNGGTPTTTKGDQWDAGDTIFLRNRDEVTKTKFILQSGVTATIDWSFHLVS